MEPSAEFHLEARISAFDVQRAIDAYIPLLEASYALARQEPITLPVGYTSLGEIRVSVMEAVELEPTLTLEERKAIENDLEAMSLRSSNESGQLEAIADPGAFGFVVQEDATGAVIISIRGTQTPEEWLANFTAIPFPFREVQGFGLVHIGFDHLYHKVRQSIHQALEGIGNQVRVTAVGHSLGGAMAILGAVDIERNTGKTNIDVCTVGGPRVGKVDFRVNFNRDILKCFRVVNRLDIVPHVPSVITGWNHVGEGIEVNGNGGNKHSLTSYLNGLRKLQPEQESAAFEPTVTSMRVP